jgi:hypothetical protein|tara:strand:+ start:350 stop:865 length:516 start_codon:yes stop_codon:yes gene_type:complete
MTSKNIFENPFCERILSLTGLIFPFLEINAILGPKVLCSTDNATFNEFFRATLVGPISMFYSSQVNHLVAFIVMIFIFDACVRKTLPLTLFTRFNIIQGILLDVICSFLGVTFVQTTYLARESTFGDLISNVAYFGVIGFICYCILMILFGRYPKIPIISEGARLNVQIFR